MLYYKINILEELKKAGYNTTIIRRRRLINESSLTAIRKGKSISWSTLEKICDLLNVQPGDIIGNTSEQITLDNQEQEQKTQEEIDKEIQEEHHKTMINNVREKAKAMNFTEWDYLTYNDADALSPEQCEEATKIDDDFVDWINSEYQEGTKTNLSELWEKFKKYI